MARINLLPWRAERRKQRQREFYAMLGMAAIGGLLLSLLIWFYYDRQVSGQMDRNAYLEAEIEKVKEQNKEIDRLDAQKDRLLARKKVIEELQAKRSQMVHLFDALVRTIPDGVVLTALQQEGTCSPSRTHPVQCTRVGLHAQPGNLRLDDQPGAVDHPGQCRRQDCSRPGIGHQGTAVHVQGHGEAAGAE